MSHRIPEAVTGTVAKELAEGTLTERTAWIWLLYDWDTRDMTVLTDRDVHPQRIPEENPWLRFYKFPVHLPIPIELDARLEIPARPRPVYDLMDRFPEDEHPNYSIARRLFLRSVSYLPPHGSTWRSDLWDTTGEQPRQFTIDMNDGRRFKVTVEEVK